MTISKNHTMGSSQNIVYESEGDTDDRGSVFLAYQQNIRYVDKKVAGRALPYLKVVGNFCMVDHLSYIIPSKPLHNHDLVSVHFNHFPCTGICNKQSRHLSMLT